MRALSAPVGVRSGRGLAGRVGSLVLSFLVGVVGVTAYPSVAAATDPQTFSSVKPVLTRNTQEASEVTASQSVAAAAAVATDTDPGTFVSLQPSRILDTREAADITAGDPVPANGVVSLQVAGAAGVPTDAAAVVLNVTVTLPAANGFVTVYPSGEDEPWVSNLNFVAGQTVPNLVVVKVGSDGKVNLKVTSSGTVHLVADVAGYFVGGEPAVAGAFKSLTPARILDTREPDDITAGEPVPANGVLSLQVAGSGGVPAGVSAVVLNVTVTLPAANGFVTVYPSGTDEPGVSNLNFTSGLTVANLVVVKVGSDGKVNLKVTSSGTVHLVADVSGFFRGGEEPTAEGAFVSIDPSRLLDTRDNGDPVPSYYEVCLGPFPSNMGALVLNVTVTQPETQGYITVYPSGTALPNVSNLNFVPNQTVPNLVTVKVGSDGYVCLANLSGGSTHLIADAAGYFITEPIPLAITTASLPAATVGAAYSVTLAATGGTTPYSWSATGLPGGLWLDQGTGVLSGTPTVTGTFSPVVIVTDAASTTASKTLTLTINDVPTVTTSSLPGWTVAGPGYSVTLAVSGGTAPFTWAATGLPAGLTLDSSSGLISGSPSSVGSFSVDVTVTDATSTTASKTLVLTVNSTPTVSTSSLPSGTVGTSYTATLAVSGGTSPYTWSASGLPAGLALDSATGVISGTPSSSGSFNVVVTVKDAASVTASRTLTLVVAS